jgi:hypothetical protein
LSERLLEWRKSLSIEALPRFNPARPQKEDKSPS